MNRPKTQSYVVGVLRYRQLYTLLARMIADGTYAAGSMLPSEPELMRHYGASRTTVRRAIGMLEEEQRVLRKQGSGTFVRAIAPFPSPAHQLTPLLEDLRLISTTGSTRLLSFEFVATPPRLLARARSFGARALYVERVWALSGEPIAVVSAYVRESAGRLLDPQSLGNHALLVALEGVGVRLDHCEKSTIAVLADPIVASHLGVLPGAPLLQTERLAFDVSGAPVERTRIVYSTDLASQLTRYRVDRSGDRLRWQPLAT